ncbi:MAG: hypothetical protein HFF36_04095 [Coprobacillus sp.]|nr:hypothetical protein [Coprobacillus sp.]
MIYPNIDRKKTEERTEKILLLISELFEMRAFTLKESINIQNKNLNELLIVNIDTEYKDITYKILKSMNYLNWTQKYIIYNRFIKNISLSDIKLGNHCEIAISNVYIHYHQTLFDLALLNAELIVYK